MNLSINDRRLDVEHGIAPPMAKVITVPIVAEMGPRGVDVVLYVSVPALGSRGVPASDRELTEVVREIIERLNKYEPSAPMNDDDCNRFTEGCK